MRMSRALPLVAALLFAASCERQPTQVADDVASIDSIDPALLTFNSTYNLPDGPFVGETMVGMGMSGTTMSAAAFPDSLKLTAAQKAAIKALRDAFAIERKADIATLQTLHAAAKAAYAAGKRGADLKPYIDAAKAERDIMRAALDALHTAIWNVLTPAQQAWVSAHKPKGP
ncbi:MAG: Spy/CpxP family protein refolding chaperone [Gemmatimonadetes bacterium]|nr:Spy/CpxP family protein refolding chaperone [Gemmatimonadota bacterium]MBI3504352.1 Spy/CpxP family protein refolding chaperone [Pseudomonadota bacterium]